MTKEKKINSNTDRQTGLDIFRLVAVLSIYLFHSHIHMGYDYGFFTSFIRMGAIFMTAFFMLSGYALFLTYQSVDLIQIKNIRRFYIKRAIGILPLYYLVYALYILFLGSESFKENVLLAPIELLGLQSFYPDFFAISHNGGTWFVSCIIMLYLLYPFMQEIVKQISSKAKVGISIFCVIILLWSPLVVYYFNTDSIYSNPFFRLLEFMIGVLIASAKKSIKVNNKFEWIFTWEIVMCEFLVLVLGVTWAVKNNLFVGDYMMYSWVALPIFIMIMFSIADTRRLGVIATRVIKCMCERSYAFWMAQFFVWKITQEVLPILNIQANVPKIILSFLINVFLTIILHDMIEKPIVKRIIQYCTEKHYL